MGKNILVVGFGPGISNAVAEKFGSSGFSVALVARNEERLAAGVKALKAKGIDAAAFPADAGDPASIREAVRKARAAGGPITVLHWNAYGGGEAADLVTADVAALHGIFDVAVVGLLAAVQEALPDRKRKTEPFWSPMAHSETTARRSTSTRSLRRPWASRSAMQRSTS